MASVLTLLKMRGIDNPAVMDLIESGEAAIVATINEQIKGSDNE